MKSNNKKRKTRERKIGEPVDLVIFSSHLLSTVFRYSDRISGISFYLSINIFYKLILSDAAERTNTSFRRVHDSIFNERGEEAKRIDIIRNRRGKITKEDWNSSWSSFHFALFQQWKYTFFNVYTQYYCNLELFTIEFYVNFVLFQELENRTSWIV